MRNIIAALTIILLGAPGCFKAEEPYIPEAATDVGIYVKNGIGQDCGNDNDCRVGLKCTALGVCEPSGAQVLGQECTTTPECQSNAYCGIPSVCVLEGNALGSQACSMDSECESLGPGASCDVDLNPATPQRCLVAGSGQEGDACVSDGDCAREFVCSYATGLIGICGPSGTTDIGGTCRESSECYGGLVCSEGICELWNTALSTAASWPGATCDVEDTITPRSYFEVPTQNGEPRSEFYRLPYPNDIRDSNAAGIQGHPMPGAGPLPFDPVERIVDAVDGGTGGFGRTPTIYFRFSTAVDYGSIVFASDQGQTNMRYVNIDQGSPNYKNKRGYVWSASTVREKYLCGHWLRMQNSPSEPLAPRTTYAAILLRSIRTDPDGASGGVPFQADADLTTLLAATAPNEPGMADAWQKYKPLREYLQDENIPTEDVLNAAVFTTDDPTAILRKGREVVQGLATPTISELVACGDGVTSPCADAEAAGRNCGEPSAAFNEFHGKIVLPVFQDGTPPYLTPEDGGGFLISQKGNPQVIRNEEVCFSLTVPSGDRPEGGWPVILYGHGTGGSFRSHATNGVATRMAQLPGGGAAVLGIDGAMHGPRRGGSSLAPEILYFNLANPVAARGNALQGAMDFYSLARSVTEGVFTDAVGAEGFTADTEKIGFWGHSQGATTGPLFLGFEPRVDIAVLSGAGAGIVQGILRKRSPIDISRGVFGVLREEADEGHPVLNLMQQYFAPIDPLNYATALSRAPSESLAPPHHLLIVYGQGDTYTPPLTTRILADALDVPVVGSALDTGLGQAFDGYLESERVVAGPTSENKTYASGSITMGMIHHSPADYDGHFVAFQNQDAVRRISGFFDSFFTTGTAVIEGFAKEQ